GFRRFLRPFIAVSYEPKLGEHRSELFAERFSAVLRQERKGICTRVVVENALQLLGICDDPLPRPIRNQRLQIIVFWIQLGIGLAEKRFYFARLQLFRNDFSEGS